MRRVSRFAITIVVALSAIAAAPAVVRAVDQTVWDGRSSYLGNEVACGPYKVAGYVNFCHVYNNGANPESGDYVNWTDQRDSSLRTSGSDYYNDSYFVGFTAASGQVNTYHVSKNYSGTVCVYTAADYGGTATVLTNASSTTSRSLSSPLMSFKGC